MNHQDALSPLHAAREYSLAVIVTEAIGVSPLKCHQCGRRSVGPIYLRKDGPVFTARQAELLPPQR